MDNLLVLGPFPGNGVAVSGTSTTAQDIGDQVVRVVMKCPIKTFVRFGDVNVGAATVSDYYLTPDIDYTIDVYPGGRYFRAITAGATGTLVWAKVA